MTDRPSERAMKAAVEMEVHAVCSTTTVGKGAALDKAFPAYDELLEALRAIVDTHYDEDNIIDLTSASSIVGRDGRDQLQLKGSFIAALERAQAALIKATA